MNDVCHICPHRCELSEGQTGLCGARAAVNGRVVCGNYGRLTSLALDPVEKKPLARFKPGKMILSAGSYGCNLRCPFCQNHEISMVGADARTSFYSPEALVSLAESLVPRGNIGLAFTYNEPLIGYEYVRDCALLLRDRGLDAVLVTNGSILEAPLRELLPLISAMNIDLKGFTEGFYRSIGGELAVVKRTIELAAACHVEVTTLIVPGLNDGEDEMRALSGWLAGVSEDLPLHVSRFFPRYKMLDAKPTPVETVRRLADIARDKLKYVYTGNI